MSPRLASLDDVDELTDDLAAAPLVAVDTEFHAERRFLPKLFLVQLHVPGRGTWLVDPLVSGLLPSLAPALTEARWLVHAGHQDLRLLHAHLGALPETVLDTQVAAGLVGMRYPAGYAALAERFLGRHVPKGQTLSDWSRRPLTADQLRYAATDVELLPAMWGALDSTLHELERHELALQAFAEHRARVTDPPPDDLRWRELPQARALTRREAATAQELVAWRLARAREHDQPPRSVLSDGLLVALARRRPTTTGELAADRRFANKLVKRYGRELVEIIARTERRPEWGWPHVVHRDTDDERLVDVLEATATIVGRTHAWSADLVVPRRLLEDLVLARPASREAMGEVLTPWRDALAGDALWAMWCGEAALTLEGGVPRLVPRPS